MKSMATKIILRTIVLGIIIISFGCSHTTAMQRMQTLIDNDDLVGLQNEVASGGDVNRALMYAVNTKHHRSAALLLDKGANPNKMALVYEIKGTVEKVGPKYFYRVEQCPGKMPLWYAISNRDREMVEILLNKGAPADHEYIESSASASDGTFADLVFMSTGVMRQVYIEKDLEDIELKNLGGVIQNVGKGGPEIILEGCKWTDRYIRQQKLQVDNLRYGSVASQLESINVYDTIVRFDSALYTKSMSNDKEIHVGNWGVMMLKMNIDLINSSKYKYMGVWGSYSDGFVKDAHIWKWETVNMSKAMRVVAFEGEDVREGYVLCNVPPRQSSARTTLMDFAKSTGDVEIIRILSERRRSK